MEVNMLFDANSNVVGSLDDILSYDCSSSTTVESLDDIMSKPSCDGGIESLSQIDSEIVQLSGKLFSQLDETSSFTQFDKFLITKIEDSISSSNYIDYNSLSSQLLDDIKNALHLGSMSSQDKNAYAISSHSHDEMYSHVEFIENPKLSSSENSTCVGTIFTKDNVLTSGSFDDIDSNPSNISCIEKQTSVLIKSTVQQEIPRPFIGTLKFIGTNTFQNLVDANQLCMDEDNLNVYPYDEDGSIRDEYSGWVFPNGSTIINKDCQLSDASLTYNGTISDDIVLPVLSNFIQIQPSTSFSSKKIDWQAGLKNHKHYNGNSQFSGTLSLDKEKTRLSCTYGTSHGLIHSSKGKRLNIIAFKYSLNLPECDFYGVKTTSSSIDIEPKPVRNIIPVMMYIGGEKDVYYLND